MDHDIFVGIILLSGALLILLSLAWWSRKRIELLASKGFPTLRELERTDVDQQ